MIADLSEVGYGVALVSDYKYGYAVENNTMRYVYRPDSSRLGSSQIPAAMH